MQIAAIHSKSHGALYIFPRENNEKGEPIIRCYTQVNRLTGEKSTESALTAKEKVTSEMVMKAIREIAHPYKFEFKGIEWYTCYPIGQRLVSRYSLPGGKEGDATFDPHHVFLAGDACHTHSPKAGQGMNTAIIDSQALAWRLNLVEKGLANREILLGTYHEERHATGKQLIDFDAEYAALFSGEVPKNRPELANMSEQERQEYFIEVQRRNAAFTTGAGVTYADNVLNFRDPRALGLAGPATNKLEPGTRLTPGWVTRWVSSKPVRIIHEIQFDAPGGFRIYVLAGDLTRNRAMLRNLASHLASPRSFLHRFQAVMQKQNRLAKGAYNRLPDALNTGLMNGFSKEVNPFFHLLLIVKQNRFRMELEDVADLGPLRAMLYSDDCEVGGARVGEGDGDESVGGLHAKWGLSEGGVVICRPDGYVGLTVGLEEGSVQGWQAVERYFDGFLRENRAGSML